MTELALIEQEEELETTAWATEMSGREYAKAIALLEMSCEGHMRRLMRMAPPGHPMQERVERFLEFPATAVVDFGQRRQSNYWFVNRLHDLRQTTMKSPLNIPGLVAPTKRSHHSKIVMSIAGMLGLKIFWTGSDHDMSKMRVYEAMLGGALHDIGQPAYCHPADEAVVDYFGVDPHEWRGLDMMFGSRSFVNLSRNMGANLGNIMAAIQERGDFAPQKLADTCGYMFHDPLFGGEELPEDFVWRVIDTVEGSQYNTIFVTDPGPIQFVLDARSRRYRDEYNSYVGRVIDAGTHSSLWYGFENDWFTAEDVMYGTDKLLDKKFTQLLRDPSVLPEWMQSVLHITRSDLTSLDRWQRESFTTEQAFLEFIARAKAEGHHILPVPVKDPCKKVVRFMYKGQRLELKAAPLDLEERDRLWHVFVWRNK